MTNILLEVANMLEQIPGSDPQLRIELCESLMGHSMLRISVRSKPLVPLTRGHMVITRAFDLKALRSMCEPKEADTVLLGMVDKLSEAVNEATTPSS